MKFVTIFLFFLSFMYLQNLNFAQNSLPNNQDYYRNNQKKVKIN